MKTIIAATVMFVLTSCTEEARNKFSRSVQQNILGEKLKVSYIDYGKVVKTWIIKDGKVTSGKENGSGAPLGYYYFYSENGYVQLPVSKTLIEEIR